MRSLSVLSVAVLLFGTARAAEEDVKAILEKGIKAHGGAEKLSKFKAGTFKGKGKVETSAGQLEFDQEVAFVIPDRFKEVAEFEVMGMKIKTVVIVNKGKTSLEVNGKEQELPEAVKNSIKEAGHRLQIGRLVPLRDKKFKLSLLGEQKVLGKPAIGILVTAKGMKDVNLYFDKKTGLLAKVEGRTIDPMTEQEVAEERIISEYGTVQGMASPKKIIINRDGKKYLEMTIEEARHLETLDDDTFKK